MMRDASRMPIAMNAKCEVHSHIFCYLCILYRFLGRLSTSHKIWWQ